MSLLAALQCTGSTISFVVDRSPGRILDLLVFVRAPNRRILWIIPELLVLCGILDLLPIMPFL